MKHFFKTKNIRLFSTLVATVLALPITLKTLTGLFNWFSPFILLNSVLLLKSLVVLNILGFLVLLISFIYKRWFCRYLCPVGFACDSVSKISNKKRRYLSKIPALGRWLYFVSFCASLVGIPLFIILDPMAIFNGFFSAFSAPFNWIVFISFLGLPVLIGIHFFIPGIWCAKICPLGGLFDDLFLLKKTTIQLIKKKEKISYSAKTSRRLFISGGLGIAAGLILPRFLQAKKSVPFRPPSSVSDPLFSTLCVRCGSCIKSCPTNIIQQNYSSGSVLTWMTPEITFKNGGYCLDDCNLCGTVCPSGSIFPFSIQSKKNLFMASIHIGLDKCLLTQQTECDRCKAVCTYKAIEIVPTQNSLIMKPIVDFDLCVGCGACAAICPADTIKMVSLHNL